LKTKGNDVKFPQLGKFEIKIAEFETKINLPLPSLNKTETMQRFARVPSQRSGDIN